MKISVLGIVLLLLALMSVCEAAGDGLSVGAIVAICVVAAILVISAIVTFLVFCIIKKRVVKTKKNEELHPNPLFKDGEDELANPAFIDETA